ncbi:MAG: 4Fe-4S binding protein [Lachnospiraceae bacterium]|nr:4Fe-4S binding protein [Lachnospiraceae bacterium]
MEDAAKESGFRIVAAVAAVAEHSIMPQYASGRPDASDKRQLEQFAEQIAGKEETAVSIPGNRPYKKAGGAGLVLKAGKGCTKCGLCAKNCPVQAIDPVNFKADSKKCISCMRCVKQCPENARTVNGAMVSIAAQVIKKACSLRKENELFL